MIKVSDLRARDVVNILDGKRLGNIVDIDLDLDNGKVTSLILPARNRRYSFFSRREELAVPWNKIIRIGRDVILVEMPVANEIDPYRRDYLLDEEQL